jgi:Cupin-like domain
MVAAFPPAAHQALDAAYPETPVIVPHALVDHPLLTLPALVDLAIALPETEVEYNPGALPVGIDPRDMPRSALSAQETIRSIEENGSWMVLKRIERHPDFAALLEATLAEIAPIAEAKTGAMLGLEGFVFISSPHAVTPFHFDPEHNILMQIRGEKIMTVFPADNPCIVDPRAHEAFHAGLHHRNLVWQDDFSALGTPFPLTPGDALYVPVKAPHWVQNGDAVSISLSVTWRSAWSYREADARAFNRLLRGLSLDPAPPRRWPASNHAKSLAHRAVRKARGLMGK